MAPSLTQSYPAFITTTSTTSCVTASFTPAAGDVIVVKALTSDSSLTFGAPSGGGLTYTLQYSLLTASFTGIAIWTAVVGGSPSSMTVTLPFSGTSRTHGMVVERWASAALAGSPAVGHAQSASGSPSATVTTVGANSAVSWVNGDWNETLGARTYVTPAIEVASQQADAHYVGDWAYQAAAVAGSQAFGLSAPSGQKWTLAGIELLASLIPVSDSDAGSGADTGLVTHGTASDSGASGAGFDGGESVVQTGPYEPVADSGAGAESAVIGISSSDAGTGIDPDGSVATPGVPVSDADQSRRPAGF